MKHQTAQNLVWLSFLLAYFAYKYLAGLQSWNTGYAIQVTIIVVLTAILPYYITRFIAARQSPDVAIGVISFTPTILAVLGYGVFFMIFIRSNFPDVSAAQVLPRGALPGISISVIQGVAYWWRTREASLAEA